MPNWVFNDLHIEGSEEAIQKVKAQLNAPYTRNNSDGEIVSYSNPVISFLNIVRPPEDKMDEYEGVHGYKDGEKQGESKYNWYNFNNREWGTKWDVAVYDGEKHSDTQLNHEEKTKLHYYFQTAWSPAIPVIEALSLQNPEVEITLDWEEEQGFGGKYFFTEGSHTILEEWDIPESHEDYVKRDNVDGCTCAREEDTDEWYDDCPGKKNFIELFAKRDVTQLT